jgi:hypothetical protein
LVYIKKCHVFNKREGTEEDSKARMKKTRCGVRVLEQEVDKYRNYSMTFKLRWKRRNNAARLCFFLELACVPFGHDGLLAWDSFSQPCVPLCMMIGLLAWDSFSQPCVPLCMMMGSVQSL